MSGRVLVLTSTWPRWPDDATTTFVPELTAAVADRGWEAVVLAPHAPGSATAEDMDGVAVHRFRYAWPERAETVCYDGGALANLRARPLEFAKVPGLVAAQWNAARRLAGQTRFDVIHAHWLVPQAFVAGLLPDGPPVVATVHGGDVFALDQGPVRRAKRSALARAAAVTVNSSATRRAVAELDDAVEVRTIPMGVEVESFVAAGRERRGDDGVEVVFVGRLVPEKGIHDLVDAVAAVAADGTDLRLTVVGDGPERNAVERRVRDAGLGGRVDLGGWRDRTEVAGHLGRADIAVAPSRTSDEGWVEAQGLAIVEAMAAGCAVVATDSGGITDAVQDGESGVLVPEADVPALAAALRDLATDPGRRTALGRAASVRARSTYALDVVADRFAELFAEVADRG